MAVDVPEAQKMSVETAIAPLKEHLPGARWTSTQTWHVTLKFFGEVAEDRLPVLIEGVDAALARAEPVRSRLLDVGAFPGMRRARVLWVGIDDADRSLARWAARIGVECEMQDDRPLHPHLTLARLKTPASIGSVVDRFRPFQLDETPFRIDRVTLFRSYPGRSGSRYEVLQEWALGTAGRL